MSASQTSSPRRKAPAGEFLKTAHWAVFLTEFHLIGSNPVLQLWDVNGI